MQQLFFGLFFTILFGCSPSTHSNQQADTGDKRRVTSISMNGSKYQIDTAMILANENLQPLINDLDKANLTTHRNTEEIPDFIKNFLDSITGKHFSISNPGEKWQATDAVLETLPDRQLVYLGLADDLALLCYKSGGIGVSEHLLILKFENQKISDLWCGNVLVDLNNEKEVLDYIKSNDKKPWGLNTNIIWL